MSSSPSSSKAPLTEAANLPAQSTAQTTPADDLTKAGTPSKVPPPPSGARAPLSVATSFCAHREAVCKCRRQVNGRATHCFECQDGHCGHPGNGSSAMEELVRVLYANMYPEEDELTDRRSPEDVNATKGPPAGGLGALQDSPMDTPGSEEAPLGVCSHYTYHGCLQLRDYDREVCKNCVVYGPCGG